MQTGRRGNAPPNSGITSKRPVAYSLIYRIWDRVKDDDQPYLYTYNPWAPRDPDLDPGTRGNIETTGAKLKGFNRINKAGEKVAIP